MTAQEMFKELGFEEIKKGQNSNIIWYVKGHEYRVIFNLFYQTYEVTEYGNYGKDIINIDLHKAIHKQCEELGGLMNNEIEEVKEDLKSRIRLLKDSCESCAEPLEKELNVIEDLEKALDKACEELSKMCKQTKCANCHFVKEQKEKIVYDNDCPVQGNCCSYDWKEWCLKDE